MAALLFVLCPVRLGLSDVRILCALVSPAKKNHQLRSVLPEIHAVARPKIDLQLHHSFPDTSQLSQVSKSHAGDSRLDLLLCLPDAQRFNPLQIWDAPVMRTIDPALPLPSVHSLSIVAYNL